MLPFPTDAEQRRQLFAQLQRDEPELMAGIASIRQQFPEARITHIVTPTVEYGKRWTTAWLVPDGLVPAKASAEKLEADRMEKERQRKAKSRRAKR
jgi:hypothetical protein